MKKSIDSLRKTGIKIKRTRFFLRRWKRNGERICEFSKSYQPKEERSDTLTYDRMGKYEIIVNFTLKEITFAK